MAEAFSLAEGDPAWHHRMLMAFTHGTDMAIGRLLAA
jgi:hypothetical protein